MMKKKIVFSLLALVLAGCAANGGGIPINFGIGIPLGIGSINLGMNTAGQMTVGGGVGVGPVGIGASVPVGGITSGQQQAVPVTGNVQSQQQPVSGSK